MAPKTWQMEYSIWHQKLVIWSTSYRNRSWPMKLIVKNSIWHLKPDKWSTPYGTQNWSFGVLHVAIAIDRRSWLHRTPYGTKKLTYGVLHMAKKEGQMECSIRPHKCGLWSTPQDRRGVNILDSNIRMWYLISSNSRLFCWTIPLMNNEWYFLSWDWQW